MVIKIFLILTQRNVYVWMWINHGKLFSTFYVKVLMVGSLLMAMSFP